MSGIPKHKDQYAVYMDERLPEGTARYVNAGGKETTLPTHRKPPRDAVAVYLSRHDFESLSDFVQEEGEEPSGVQ